jgi:hypothetical protein
VSALFAIHPLAVTPLAWVADRSDLGSLTAALGVALLTQSQLLAPRPWKVPAQLALLLLGLGTKETCAAVVLVLAGAALVSPEPARGRLLRMSALQGAVVALFFLYGIRVMTNPAVIDTDLSLIERVALSAAIHVGYARELVLPWTLSVCDGSLVPQHGMLLTIVALALSAGGLWMWRVGRGQPLLWLGLFWAVCFLAPTSGVLPLKHVRADRYLYHALPGLLLAATVLFSKVPRPALVRPLGFTAAFVYLAGCLFARAEHFASARALWSWEVERNAQCMEGWLNLAREAHIAGDMAAAEAALARLVETPRLVAFWDRV